jgi:hypothetical protein
MSQSPVFPDVFNTSLGRAQSPVAHASLSQGPFEPVKFAVPRRNVRFGACALSLSSKLRVPTFPGASNFSYDVRNRIGTIRFSPRMPAGGTSIKWGTPHEMYNCGTCRSIQPTDGIGSRGGAND